MLIIQDGTGWECLGWASNDKMGSCKESHWRLEIPLKRIELRSGKMFVAIIIANS